MAFLTFSFEAVYWVRKTIALIKYNSFQSTLHKKHSWPALFPCFQCMLDVISLNNKRQALLPHHSHVEGSLDINIKYGSLSEGTDLY